MLSSAEQRGARIEACPGDLLKNNFPLLQSYLSILSSCETQWSSVSKGAAYPRLSLVVATRTPFDKRFDRLTTQLRTGFDMASTPPFDYALRQAQDAAQDTVSACSGCWSSVDFNVRRPFTMV